MLLIVLSGLLLGASATGSAKSDRVPGPSISSQKDDSEEIAAMIGRKIVYFLWKSCIKNSYQLLPEFRFDWTSATKTGDPAAMYRAQYQVEQCVTQSLNALDVFGVVLTLPPLPPSPPPE